MHKSNNFLKSYNIKETSITLQEIEGLINHVDNTFNNVNNATHMRNILQNISDMRQYGKKLVNSIFTFIYAIIHLSSVLT
jgi:hypothetical protein